MDCQYNSQGFFTCAPKKVDKPSACPDSSLKYVAADANYDMHMKSMLYQLRVTPDGYRDYIAKNKSE